MAFLDELRTAFADRARHTALVWHGRSFAYGELEGLVRGAAALLQARGMGPGDRVVLWAADRFGFLVAHLGVMLGGGVAVPLNPRFTPAEMRHFLADSGARLVVAGPDQTDALEALRPGLPDLRAVVPVAEVAAAPPHAPREPATGPDDPCLILYSSGTTGWPKGV